jgi:hypothetical protein
MKFAELMVLRQLITTYSLEQNEVAKRKNRTAMIMVRKYVVCKKRVS